MERIIENLPINHPKFNVIEISLSYDKGGINYFTGTKSERGIYLMVRPAQKDNGNTVYEIFKGYKKLVKPLKRFSKKQLNEFNPDKELINEMVNKVLKDIQ